MDSVLLESPTMAKPLPFAPLAAPRYESILKESVDRFLAESQRGTLDLSAFRSVLSRLLHSTADPPLELVWFYSAVASREAAASAAARASPLARVLAVKDLLHLLEACSASLGPAKSVALLAPAVADLYRCVLEEERAEKKVWKEIEGLVEGILSYISICSGKGCGDGEDFDSGLLPCFLDVVRVWTVGNNKSGSGLEVLFPLVGGEVRGRLGEDGCGIWYLAGVVIAEAFMLRLCLKVKGAGEAGEVRVDLQKELRIWAISSVTAFRNPVFYEILLRLLLDPTLPVAPLLNLKDANLVRDILYDVVVLVDYSFLNHGMEVDQSYGCTMNLAISRLIVTNDAIRIAMTKGDHVKSISYMSAFSTSCLPNQLVKWVASQIGMERLNRPNATSPQLFLRWLVGLEEQGLKLFVDNMSNIRTKLIVDESDTAVSVLNSKSNKTDSDLFFIDNKGEVGGEGVGSEEMESMDTIFLSAARSMKSPASNGRRKRKESGGNKVEAPVKFVKYKIHDSSVKEYFSPSLANGISSGSEVDNPPSDDEMEEVDS